jgi:PilZ domain
VPDAKRTEPPNTTHTRDAADASEPPSSNSRRAPRQQYVNFIWFQRIDRGVRGHERGIASTCDVADGGVGFVTTHTLPTGAQVFLVIVTPSGRVSAIGTVAHCHDLPGGNHRVGVSVQIVPPTDRAMWATITKG